MCMYKYTNRGTLYTQGYVIFTCTYREIPGTTFKASQDNTQPYCLKYIPSYIANCLR